MRVTLYRYLFYNTAAYRDINWISVMEKMQFLSSWTLLKSKHCWNTIYLSWFF